MPGNEYADGMWEHDQDVGKLLKTLDDLGIANDTIVVYTTDNGPNQFTWPDAATTPFRSEKDSNWEGAFRVPGDDPLAGPHQAGRGLQRDCLRPRLVPDAAGRRRRHRRSRTELLKGWAPRRTDQFKVHLDGYNQLPYPDRQATKSARKEFFYFDDDGQLVATRSRRTGSSVFCETARAGRLRSLAGAVHLSAGPEDVQPADGSLRARRHRLRPVQRLADQERLPERRATCTRRTSCKPSWTIRRASRPASFTIDQVENDVEAKIKAQAEAMGRPPAAADPMAN